MILSLLVFQDFVGYLVENKLSGELPPQLGNLTNLRRLSVTSNNLTGKLPRQYEQLTNLLAFGVGGNNLSGPIDPFIAKWVNLTALWVSDLNNTGFSLPNSTNFEEMEDLILRNCSITGPIPEYIGTWSELTNLKVLTPILSYELLGLMAGNMLNGALADTINYENLEKADLSYNNFTFPEPDRNFTNKIMDERCPHRKSKKPKYSSLFINAGSEATDFEGNHYDADESNSSFYDTLYAKPRLCPQSLTYYGFCLRNGNYTVQLHFAETIYARDEDHSITGKRVFDIYIQRNLERKDFNIKENAGGPHTPLVENFTAINVHDNLLVIGLFWAGKGSLYNPPNFNGPIISAISVKPEFRVGGLSSAKIAGITVGAIFISTSFTDFHVENGLAGTKRVSRSETLELRGKTYTAKQVIDATRNFSHKLEIGNGRFGIVYKAELPDQTVAVKRLSSQSKQVIDQIGREVYTLKTVKHQNLLEFLDVYTKKDLHMLIYELKFQLGTQLDTRFYICLGIARGLKYLHEDSRLKIIHRNIKPSNILLDGELNAKVSAFGLAKLYEGENLNVVIGAGDTLVYMAPEYATANVITEKADVYSFGIVLLEIVSGKKNADYRPNQETVYLIDDACVLHSKGKLVNLIDEKLQTYDRKQALDVLNIAILCIDRSPTLRPTMSEVVSVLEGNKKIEELSKVATSST
ncbi:hypothetical protein Q3G72_010615 [Acer saccharum]|nr:hypothetical protein Q3G72_010615 [Acer saccharum]